MSKGWECPKCGWCYAPFIMECKNCNKEIKQVINKENSLREFMDEFKKDNSNIQNSKLSERLNKSASD